MCLIDYYIEWVTIIKFEDTQVNEADKELIDKLGITCETKIIYRYKQYQYTSLKDAINYAKLDQAHSDAVPERKLESKEHIQHSMPADLETS